MFEKCVSVAPPKAWAASNRSSASNDDGSAIKIDFWAGVYGVVAWIDVGIAGVALLVWLGSDAVSRPVQQRLLLCLSALLVHCRASFLGRCYAAGQMSYDCSRSRMVCRSVGISSAHREEATSSLAYRPSCMSPLVSCTAYHAPN